jgi:hypothetical protein
MKCPHCGSQFVVHSENRVSNLIRAVARSNKWHCGDCHMKWKARARGQGVLAREVLAVCFVSLFAFIVLRMTGEPGGSFRPAIESDPAGPAGAVENGKKAALDPGGSFRKMSLAQKLKLKGALKGGGMEGIIAKYIAGELKNRKLTADYKRQLREQHKDVIAKMSRSEKEQVKTIIKQMNLE